MGICVASVYCGPAPSSSPTLSPMYTQFKAKTNGQCSAKLCDLTSTQTYFCRAIWTLHTYEIIIV